MQLHQELFACTLQEHTGLWRVRSGSAPSLMAPRAQVAYCIHHSTFADNICGLIRICRDQSAFSSLTSTLSTPPSATPPLAKPLMSVNCEGSSPRSALVAKFQCWRGLHASNSS